MPQGLWHLPPPSKGETQIFRGGGRNLKTEVWRKPKGHTMAQILAIGAGGGGGAGVIGANSVAAGGGGGGSGGQSRLTIPLILLPDVLFVQVDPGTAGGGGVATLSTCVDLTIANCVLLVANGGGVGSAGSAGVGGAGGANASTATIATCPLAGLGIFQFLGGQAGGVGGAAITAADVTLPVIGLVVTGGVGGGGLPAAATAGTNGGGFVAPPAPNVFPSTLGGQGSATATNPAAAGIAGMDNVFPELWYSYGGTGGASTHGTATGGGLVQGAGGNGGAGSGGGGSGGALTGSSSAAPTVGGDAILIIVSW